MINFQEHAEGVVIPIRANAGARKNEIGGQHDGMLKVSVTQAPENGKANSAIVALLCKRLKLAKSNCELVSGATSSQKRLLVRGIDLKTLRELLDQEAQRFLAVLSQIENQRS